MVDDNTLCDGFVGFQERLPASLWHFPVVHREDGIGLYGREWSCRSFWEFGEGFLCDGGLAGCVGRRRVKGADEGDATEDEGHVTG